MAIKFFVTCVLLLVTHLAVALKTPALPNVLLIAIDDLRPMLGTYGDKKVVSPNIDKIASQGIVFENAFSSVPVCGASRASLLTGIRPTINRYVTYNTKIDVDTVDATSIPKFLKSHGYTAISLGKISHTPKDIIDHWSSKPIGTKGAQYHTAQQHAILKKRNSHKAEPYEAADVPDNNYRDYKTVTSAIDSMSQLKEDKKPFFLAVGITKPHLPFSVPKKYWDMYDSATMQLPENYKRAQQAPDLAFHTFNELRAYYNVPSKGSLSDDMARKMIHGYYASVSFADAQVGRIVNALDKLGLTENTIVILLGDHGYHLGEQALWNKHSNFRLANHTPLIFNVPGKKKNLRTSAMIEFVDIFPTLVDLLDLPHPKQLQGESVAHLFDNPSAHKDTAAHARYSFGDTVFTERFAYTEFYDKKNTKKVVGRMLYDHETDPNETVNVVNNTKYKTVVDKLAVILEQKKKKADLWPLK